MARLHAFDRPDRFCVGALGEGEGRRYCLQVREDGTLVTVAISRANLAALRHTLESVLADRGNVLLPQRGTAALAPLDAPVEPAFDVAALAVFDDARAGVLLVLASREELFGSDPGGDGSPFDLLAGALADPAVPGSLVAVRLGSAELVDFIGCAAAVLADGRPACPLCRQSVDATGHVCPRRNGYRGPDAWPSPGATL